MSSGELLILLALVLPLFSAAVSYAVGRMPDVRETLTLVACIGLCIITIAMFMRVGAGDAPELVIAQPMSGRSSPCRTIMIWQRTRMRF